MTKKLQKGASIKHVKEKPIFFVQNVKYTFVYPVTVNTLGIFI